MMTKVTKEDIRQVAPFLWEIPKSFNPRMLVPAQVFALEVLLDDFIEDRSWDQLMKVIVHRKGATRAFGPHFEELPESFRYVGQPVMIPGSMGTSSFVLVGTSKSMDLSLGSCCHGAGRRLSRSAAKRLVNAPQLKKTLHEQGIFIEAGSFRGIAEEAPLAYKDVNLVVETVHQARIAKKVARLKPLAVIKG